MAARAQISMHRHLHAMSEKDVETVVHAVADLIVTYLSQNPEVLPCAVAPSAVRRTNQPAAKSAPPKETQA